MKLSDFVFKFLEDKNVDSVFTVSGGGAIHLCDSLGRSESIKYYCCHHEQAVSMAAEGYTRTSGRPGVCLVTSGPGGTNAITGAACAWADSIPQIIISGQVYLHQTIGESGLRQLGVQESNIIDLVKPITKYAEMVKDPEDILHHLEKAWELATTGRPGPVWLDIPGDIQNAQIDPDTLKVVQGSVIEVEEESIEQEVRQVVEWLKCARRPMLHIGQGVRISKAGNLLLKLLDQLPIPLATTWNATDVIDSEHPCFVGRPGVFSERAANFIVQNADLHIAIGTRLPFMVTGYNAKDFARESKRVMVDIDPKETKKKSLDVHLKIVSDAGRFLSCLMELLTEENQIDSEWLGRCQALRNRYPIVDPQYSQQEEWVNSYYFIQMLSDALDSEAAVMTDMGLSFVGTHQAFKIKKGQVVCTNSGHAPMGWGLPAAIGSCVARNGRKTICISGEGGLMMNIQELSTAMHHSMPIKLFIYNNGGYLTIKQTQQLGFEGRLMGADYESGLSFPSFEPIALAHGFSYSCFSNNRQLDEGLRGFLDSEEAGICELLIDPEQPQIPKAISVKQEGGIKSTPVYEDLYPFLSSDEYERITLK